MGFKENGGVELEGAQSVGTAKIFEGISAEKA